MIGLPVRGHSTTTSQCMYSEEQKAPERLLRESDAPSCCSGCTTSCTTGAPSGRYTLSGTLLTALPSGARPSELEVANEDGVGEREAEDEEVGGAGSGTSLEATFQNLSKSSAKRATT